MFKRIGLIAKYASPQLGTTLRALAALLQRRGIQVLLDEDTAEQHADLDLAPVSRDDIGSGCDLCIVIGGDGTLLNSARQLVDHGIPLLGVNLGRLGFLVDVSPAELEDALLPILDGQFTEEERFLLEAEIRRGDTVVARSAALNEVVIHKWDVSRMIELSTAIDGKFLYTLRADGLIIATPTGSTAYALSGGGPILHPSLNAVVLVPICPHTLSNRPIVVDGSSAVEVEVHDQGNNAQVTCDGQVELGLMAGDRIVIRKKDRRLRLLHPLEHDFFRILRAKLHWGRKLT